MRHSPVVQSPVFNNCLKVNIDGHKEPQIVPKLLQQVFVIKTNNILVSDPLYVRLKEVRDAENIIIVSDSTLHLLLLPQFKKMS